MKKTLILSLALFLSSCAGCNKEDEDFAPYPGGKGTEQTPQTSF